MLALVRRIVLSQMSLMIVGGLIAAALLWFVSPLIGRSEALSSNIARVFEMTLVPAIMGIGMGLVRWRDRRDNSRMAAAIADTGGTGAATASQEVQALSVRFREALDILKRSRFGKAAGGRWLYQLPWYVLIGPPGSGKTTAIANSGLNFPLFEKFGRRGIGGIGGTRSCDWWFTDEAVLIDTAGRYTSQDSAPETDRTAWIGFLRLLKKYRRRQPLNGIIVAIGTSELIAASDAERQNHAQRIRQRVTEIYAELGVRLPVYVLFTKVDLIAGFVEFFDDLGREGREQVWGLTFDYTESAPEDDPLPLYGQEFDALIGRLNERLLERLQQEADLQRRAVVFGFPQQMASLKDLIGLFLQEAFQANSFEQPMLLRGVYFASGTQVGAPFDRVMQAMSSMFGIAEGSAVGAAQNARSFFINRLLRDVVFGEAALVDADPRIETRRRRITRAVRLGAAAVVLVGGSAFAASFLANRRLVQQTEAAAMDYSVRARALQPERVDDPDLRKVVPLLDRLRDLTQAADGNRPAEPLVASFGLSQAGKLQSQAAFAYRKALGDLMLPRLILRLEQQIAQHLDNADFLDESLKVYLMLGRQGPLDRDLVTRWLALDWQAAYPGDSDAALRTDLARHLQALLAEPFPGIVLNGAIIERARDALRRVPLAQRVYAGIIASPAAASLPEWRVSDAAGPNAQEVFKRRSGRPLSAGIPGIYTEEGFRKAFLPRLDGAAREAADDAWVFGSGSPGSDPAKLEQDITGLYLQDFAQHWDQLIDDIAIVHPNDLQGVLRVLDVLSSPISPIRLLVVAAAKETRLAPPASGTGTASGAAEEDRLRRLLGTPAGDSGSPAGVAASFSTAHFQDLQSLTSVPPNSPPNAPLPIDGVIADLGRLDRSMGDAADASAVKQSDAAAASADRMQEAASSLPQPMRGWILGVTKTSADMSLGGARDKLLATWRGGAGPACESAVVDRYPFRVDAPQDVPLRDFAQLFGHDGTLDRFFKDNLDTLVDTSHHPWRWRKSGAEDTGLGTEPLHAFEVAAAIRDSYFVGATPSLGFTLTPTALGDATASVTLTSDGQTVSYDHGGVATPVRLQWPGPGGSSGATISFKPRGAGAPEAISATGPWAWFHVLDHAQIRRLDGSNHFSLSFSIGSYSARFDMEAEGPTPPIPNSPALEFHCPWPQ